MSDTYPYAELLLSIAGVGIVALVSNRVSERIRIPAPALFLIAAAIVVNAIASLRPPPAQIVERIVVLALLFILFDGGMHIGLRRFREAAAPILVVGVVGTFATTVAVAVLAHLAFGFDWYVAVLLGAAVAPTDPAVVFSVLGRREITGRTSTILEGESGANDPVGIALLVSLLAAHELSADAIGHVAGEFFLQMSVGAVIGVAAGRALVWTMRRVPLPSEGLHVLRSVAWVLGTYGLTTVAHGSGFLAVLVAGVVAGDERAPFKREVERFHGALASLGEVAAFVVLGLTVDLGEIGHTNVWVPGLVLGVVLACVLRPVLVGLCLLPARLRRNEAAFVLFAGLKGAVPILLGTLVVTGGVPHAARVYGIVIVVVVLSVVLQGGLVPEVARLLKLPMTVSYPQPYALGVRLAEEPEGVLRLRVRPGSPADGATVDDLAASVGDIWVNLVVRDERLLTVRGDTELRAGDEVVVSTQDESVRAAFG
ncbi:MAG TPA: cation:proton antiporter [Mycobacteriales bacterium]